MTSADMRIQYCCFLVVYLSSGTYKVWLVEAEAGTSVPPSKLSGVSAVSKRNELITPGFLNCQDVAFQTTRTASLDFWTLYRWISSIVEIHYCSGRSPTADIWWPNCYSSILGQHGQSVLDSQLYYFILI